jgi:hypothetical protein
MASGSGRHEANDNSVDQALLDYLSNGADPAAVADDLSAGDRAELDELRALLADPTLWSEPPAALEDAVVALISAEAAGREPAVTAGSATTDPATGVVDTGTPTPTTGTGPLVAPVDLAAARERRQEARRLLRPAFLVGAAAAVAAIALTTVLLLQRDSTAERRFDVALAPTELVPGAAGSATMLRTDSGWEITLQATGLPRLDNGEFYQGWLRNADGVLVPIGTFNEGTDVVLWAGVSPETFSTLTITRESADGNQDSSGQRVLVGTAVEE